MQPHKSGSTRTKVVLGVSLRFRIVFSSACALLALLLCLAYADGVRADAEKTRAEAIERYGGEVTKLVVASERLEQGDTISKNNTVERDWVSDLAPEGAFTSMDELLGSEVTVAVEKGVPLTQLNFRKRDEIEEVPQGHVALSIPITDKLGVSRSVAKGTLLIAYAVTGDGTRLVSEDMTVLSEPSVVAGSLGSTPQITVSVLPNDVAAVLDASATGDLRLVVPASDVDTEKQGDEKAPVEIASSSPKPSKEDDSL